ncbi:MAG: DUF2975 domain-containing protein [Gammaproteobacteria bacterium]|nr:DUF2975 domain-containing protein [Gammaproteobacteria bacterium]
MTQQFSRLISLGCMALLIATPFLSLYFLINIELFATMTRSNLGLTIEWQTVTDIQWYSLWLLTIFYIAIGLAGLYFLRRAFSNFAKGQLFNHSNSRDLRLFSILLFAQALAKPLHFSISSVLLSLNHPAGQKMLSVSFGSNEVKVIALAMMLWVISDLLVQGSKLESENKQFI